MKIKPCHFLAAMLVYRGRHTATAKGQRPVSQ